MDTWARGIYPFGSIIGLNKGPSLASYQLESTPMMSSSMKYWLKANGKWKNWG